MDQFLEQSAPYLIAVGLMGMVAVVGLLIYMLARLARAAAMIEESVLHQRRAIELKVRGIEIAGESLALQRESSGLALDRQGRGIELAEESLALQRESNRLLKECLDRPRREP